MFSRSCSNPTLSQVTKASLVRFRKSWKIAISAFEVSFEVNQPKQYSRSGNGPRENGTLRTQNIFNIATASSKITLIKSKPRKFLALSCYLKFGAQMAQKGVISVQLSEKERLKKSKSNQAKLKSIKRQKNESIARCFKVLKAQRGKECSENVVYVYYNWSLYKGSFFALGGVWLVRSVV